MGARLRAAKLATCWTSPLSVSVATRWGGNAVTKRTAASVLSKTVVCARRWTEASSPLWTQMSTCYCSMLWEIGSNWILILQPQLSSDVLPIASRPPSEVTTRGPDGDGAAAHCGEKRTCRRSRNPRPACSDKDPQPRRCTPAPGSCLKAAEREETEQKWLGLGSPPLLSTVFLCSLFSRSATRLSWQRNAFRVTSKVR